MSEQIFANYSVCYKKTDKFLQGNEEKIQAEKGGKAGKILHNGERRRCVMKMEWKFVFIEIAQMSV